MWTARSRGDKDGQVSTSYEQQRVRADSSRAAEGRAVAAEDESRQPQRVRALAAEQQKAEQ